MNQTEILFCKCIRLSLHPEELPSFPQTQRDEMIEQLSCLRSLAEKHSLIPNLYEGLCLLDIPLPDEEREYFRQRATGSALSSYHMLAFTRKILDILHREHIHYLLLKGATLLECFPKLELRAFGDVDILVPDPQEFEQLKKYLLSHGFYAESSFAEHHLEMYCFEEGKKFLLEIHHKVIARQANPEFNRAIKEIFHSVVPTPGEYPDAALSFQMLPETENALYLLLHMMQHFLGSGFGIRLLLDWTAYLEKHGDEIDNSQFQIYLEQLGLTTFCHAVTSLCQTFLELNAENISFSTEKSLSNDFLSSLMDEIIDAGTFGKTDQSRMLIMSGGGRYSQYFIELHRQMKKRFQKLYKIIPLWPILWIITGVCFLWNNYFIRGTKTREILATANKRQKLLKELALFQKGGDTNER